MKYLYINISPTIVINEFLLLLLSQLIFLCVSNFSLASYDNLTFCFNIMLSIYLFTYSNHLGFFFKIFNKLKIYFADKMST